MEKRVFSSLEAHFLYVFAKGFRRFLCKHNIDMKKRKKTQKNYHCKKCDYTSSNKTDFNRHLSTTKHAMLTNVAKMLTQKTHICCCGRSYKHRQSLSVHKKKCTYTVVKPVECEMVAQPDEKEVIIILNTILKENRELRKEMKNMKINNTINNNKKYNINVFLNEHCKDAMCLEDFISNMHVTLQDVIRTTQVGFAGGVSNILIKNLNDLSALKRPIHCSDLKRQKFYVKDKEGWSVDASNQKVDKVIDDVAIRQFTKIKDWTNANSDYLTNDTKLKEWQTMIHKLSGPSDNNISKDTKVIKKNMGENTNVKDAMLTVD